MAHHHQRTFLGRRSNAPNPSYYVVSPAGDSGSSRPLPILGTQNQSNNTNTKRSPASSSSGPMHFRQSFPHLPTQNSNGGASAGTHTHRRDSTNNRQNGGKVHGDTSIPLFAFLSNCSGGRNRFEWPGRLELILPDSPKLVPLSNYIHEPSSVPILPLRQATFAPQQPNQQHGNMTTYNNNNKRRNSSYGSGRNSTNCGDRNPNFNTLGARQAANNNVRMRADLSPRLQQRQQIGHQLHQNGAKKIHNGDYNMSNTLPMDSNFYKTSLCSRFMSTGLCAYGNSCRFAHGDNELRRTPIKALANPLVNERYKTLLCKPYMENGQCKYGVQCLFAHGHSELRSGPLSYGNIRR